jgi:hypothetical protein
VSVMALALYSIEFDNSEKKWALKLKAYYPAS